MAASLDLVRDEALDPFLSMALLKKRPSVMGDSSILVPLSI